MNILQLSADFQYQKLYPNLVRALSSKNISQIVYLQSRNDLTYDELNNIKNVNLVNTFKYRIWMKFLFKKRIQYILSDIENNVDVNSINLTMSYFLFSDGSVANEIFKKYKVPFVVAIRNSDINHYFKYRFWLKKYIKEVLNNASVIIFPSPSYIKILNDIVGDDFFNNCIRDKIEVVGNLISDHWFSNPKIGRSILKSDIRLLYAGEFSRNKRIDVIINSFLEFKKKYKASLYLVGNYGDDAGRVHKITLNQPDIFVIDKIEDTKRLVSIFDNSDIFIMPSKNETFGNVYIEAMARGLPVIYTKGQGIDGYFSDGEVGFCVQEPLEQEILDSLEKIVGNYSCMSEQARNNSLLFSKNCIVEKYLCIFHKVTS